MADQINTDHTNTPTAQTGIPADAGVTYHGWDGERALGFKAVRVDGRIEYTYLRPALGDNGAPAVTLHQDRTGDAAGEPIATYAVFPPDVEATTVDGPHHAAPCDITLADVFFRPWTDTFAVGWEVIDPATDRRMVVYINPSTGDAGGDPESTPCVFVYQGTEGDPSIDGTRCFLDVFTDAPPLKDYTVVYRLDAITAATREDAAKNAAVIMREVLGGQHGGSAFEVYDGDVYAPHGRSTTVDVDLPVYPDLITKKLTLDQLRERADEYGNVHAFLAIDMDDVIGCCDWDALHAGVAEILTGDTDGVEDITVDLVGSVRRPGAFGALTAHAVFKIDAAVSPFLDGHTCDTPECGQDYEEDGDGYAGRCPGCADILHALEEAGDEIDWDGDTRTRAELEAARDALDA